MQSQGPLVETQVNRNVSSTYETATPQQLADAGIQPIVLNDRRNQLQKPSDVYYQQKLQPTGQNFFQNSQNRPLVDNQFHEQYRNSANNSTYHQNNVPYYASEEYNVYHANVRKFILMIIKLPLIESTTGKI